jgi:hypothetical protein
MKRIVFVAAVVLTFGVCVQARTLAEMRRAERFKINDSTDTVSVPHWSDAELNIRNNDVQRNVSQYTRCLYVSSITTPVAEVREYSKPPNCISIDRVSYLQTTSTTSYKKLMAYTMGGLDVQFPTWEYNVSGRPLYYYERGNVIGFERPVSAAAVSTGSIKIDYFKYTTDMVADSDKPYDGVDYLQLYDDIIILGVAASCKYDEHKATEGDRLQAEYTSKINMFIQSLATKSDQSVQKITIK